MTKKVKETLYILKVPIYGWLKNNIYYYLYFVFEKKIKQLETFSYLYSIKQGITTKEVL